MMRAFRGIPSKSGKPPSFRFSEGTVRHTIGASVPTLVVKSHSRKKQIITEVERHPDGRVALEMEGSGSRPMTARHASELSRALLTSALECAWIDYGEMMLEPRFDHIREAVLGTPRNGCFALETNANAGSPVAALTYQLQPYEREWRMLVGVQYYGVFVGTDSRLPGPLIDVPSGAPVMVVGFTSTDFPPEQDAGTI